MASEAEFDQAVEAMNDQIETAIGKQRGGSYVFSQEESIDMLDAIASFCRDRAQTIREELGG